MCRRVLCRCSLHAVLYALDPRAVSWSQPQIEHETVRCTHLQGVCAVAARGHMAMGQLDAVLTRRS
jgi:hypothetical protein